MESFGGSRSYSAIEQVAATLILLCAALHYFKSQMESLEGFKFHPTIGQILRLLEKKRLDPHFSHRSVKDIDDICSLEPWDLPRETSIESEEQFWYFFYEPFYKYKESNRVHRRTNEGYWKVTGKGSSEIITRNGLTGSKKILTFHRHGPASKEAKTQWVMHEFHVRDNPSYKKEFVLCRIERKWDKKHGISTPEEGESSQQLVSPTQLLPGDHLISNGNHRDENVTNPQPPSPNLNLISYPGNQLEQNTPTNPQLPPNHNMISYYGNHFEQSALANQKLLPNHTMVSYPANHIEQNTPSNNPLFPTYNMVPYHGNHIVQNTLSNTQLPLDHNLIFYPGNHILLDTLSNPRPIPNHNLISCSGNHTEQNTNPQLVPNNLFSYPRNHVEENTLSNPHLLSNDNLISIPRNHIEDNTFTELQLPPNSALQLVPNQLLVKNNVAENTLQEENHLLGEHNAGSGGHNGLNYASFSTLQSPNDEEMELSYSIDNFNFWNSQFDSGQVNEINLRRAFQDENSTKETGQTHTPDFKSSKSDGGTYAEDSSDTNTETFDAWFDELLLDNIAQVA